MPALVFLVRIIFSNITKTEDNIEENAQNCRDIKVNMFKPDFVLEN